MRTILSIFFALLFFLFSSEKPTPYSPAKKSDTLSYSDLLQKVSQQRIARKDLYDRADALQKASVCKAAATYLTQTLYEGIFPYWYGTKWEFYGKSLVPNQGSIACGRFVVTTLAQLGVKFSDPNIYAEDYSAYMVNSLCDTSYKVYKAEEMIKIVESQPDNVWVTGLSSHSGFIVRYKGRAYFVHSNYTYPSVVEREDIRTSEVFNGSRIFVVGALFAGNSLPEKWLRGDTIMHIKRF
jgi:hypothetical protein